MLLIRSKTGTQRRPQPSECTEETSGIVTAMKTSRQGTVQEAGRLGISESDSLQNSFRTSWVVSPFPEQMCPWHLNPDQDRASGHRTQPPLSFWLVLWLSFQVSSNIISVKPSLTKINIHFHSLLTTPLVCLFSDHMPCLYVFIILSLTPGMYTPQKLEICSFCIIRAWPGVGGRYILIQWMRYDQWTQAQTI